MPAIFTPDHVRLVQVALPVCDRYGLALAGGHAVAAHGVVVRPAKGLDLVSGASTPIGEIATALADAYRRAGFRATAADRPGDDPVMVRLEVTLPRDAAGDGAVAGRAAPYEALSPGAVPDGAKAYRATLYGSRAHGGRAHGGSTHRERTHEVGVLKEPLSRPPVRLGLEGCDEPVPVAALKDRAAMKTAALGGRSAPRDLIDVHDMTTHFSQGELLAMAGAFDEDFRAEALAERLDKLASLDDRSYTAYRLDETAARGLRRWAMDWAQDIRLDLMEGMEHPDDFYEESDDL